MEPFRIRCLISGSQTGNALSAFEEIVSVGEGPPMHIHREQIEIFHVISGQFEFTVDGQIIQAGPGDTAIVPAGAAHRFQNSGTVDGVLHFELLPSGSSEEFFDRISNNLPSMEELPAFFSQHGIDLVAP